MGRPTKYSTEVVDAICNALEVGADYQDACWAAGVSDETFSTWRKSKLGFLERIKEAEARGRIQRLERITQKAQSGDWAADAWVLERRRPDAYGRRDVTKVEQSGTITHRGKFKFEYEPQAEFALAQIEAGSEGDSK